MSDWKDADRNPLEDLKGTIAYTKKELDIELGIIKDLEGKLRVAKARVELKRSIIEKYERAARAIENIPFVEALEPILKEGDDANDARA